MRWCLKQDNDSHWYCILLSESETFTDLLKQMGSFDIRNQATWKDEHIVVTMFEEQFGKFRIDGPHNLTFTGPLEGRC